MGGNFEMSQITLVPEEQLIQGIEMIAAILLVGHFFSSIDALAGDSSPRCEVIHLILPYVLLSAPSSQKTLNPDCMCVLNKST